MNTGELPRQEDLAAVRILEEIEKNPALSQREISRRVGVSLGMTNLLIQRMAAKAWLKVRTVPGRRLLYAVTPRGVAEKLRKAHDFIRLSLRYYGEMRRSVADRIREAGPARPRVAVFGSGEMEGIVAEAVREASGRYLGPWPNGRKMSRPDVLVLLERPGRELREEWERGGIRMLELF